MIEIRRATPADVPAIVDVETGEEGPWAEPESCRQFVERSLARGYLIQVAFLDGAPAGHAEWIKSDERAGHFFYLSVLQVKKVLQKRGVGRQMVEAGEAEARRHGCERVTLIPELETGSDVFYEKLGYRKARTLARATATAEAGAPIEMIERIPERVVRAEKFVLGLMQTSSRHMWELIEHPADGEARVCRARLPGGYVALRWFPGKTPAALAWGDFKAEDARAGCAALAHQLDFPAFSFVLDTAEAGAYEGVSTAFEMEKRL